MIYLLECTVPDNKSVYYGLTYVYGISSSKSFLICRKLGLSQNFKVENLSSVQIFKISRLVESLAFIVANDLKRIKLLNRQKLLFIKSYRGLRRKHGFPVRGQRTHTNARTAKKRLK